jgi:hypothetical protein
VLVAIVTVFFGWHALSLEMASRFDELLPTNHPFLEVHREHAKTFGGANTVLVMLEVEEGDIFTRSTLQKIFDMTKEIDKLYGVNHYQVESLAHRTNRTLRVEAGGIMEMRPVMEGGPKSSADVDRVRRIVHASQNLYGVLVSLDNKAALIRASFIEGRLDHERLFRDLEEKVVRPFADANTRISIAGEPQLYGWVYHYTAQIWWILGATVVLSWILLFLYFRDWRGALRPTISGAIAAVWGLGFIELVGFSLDPLTLVIPFFITARAVSHSAQMHERYYEEYFRSGWNREEAIVRSFAALFVPTLAGVLTDALGVLAILLVPIVFLQKLAMTASFWIAAILVSELLLNPVVYSLLRAPERSVVETRQAGAFQRSIDRMAASIVARRWRGAIFAVWAIVLGSGALFWTRLVVGDSEAVTPLLERDSEYNSAHHRIQERFGGVEPLIVVVEATAPGAMRVPENVRSVERFQRTLERDPEVGASFSFVDVITTMSAALHEWEPKWAVVPSRPETVSMLFGAFFMGTSYQETARFMDPTFSQTAIFFYAANHRGPTIQRIITRSRDFIARESLEGARYRLAGGLIGVLAAANEEMVRNDVLLNVVGYATIFVIVALTYRSFAAALFLMLPLVVANAVVNAYMGARGIGINVHTLPVITVGIGFGIDFAFYIVSRVREELAAGPGLEAAVSRALSTAGKAVAFTAATMIAGVLFWTFCDIRFNAEMGLLLGLWMLVSFLASMTLLPASLLSANPRFLSKGVRS